VPNLRHVVCPHCAATNRIPADRPASEARCGACHQSLFDGHTAAVDATTFEKHRRNNDIPVLLDVWAPWCGPCRVMAPMFEQAARELEPDVRLIKLNADEEPRVSSELGVASIPTLFLLRGGRVPGADRRSDGCEADRCLGALAACRGSLTGQQAQTTSHKGCLCVAGYIDLQCGNCRLLLTTEGTSTTIQQRSRRCVP